MVVTQRMLCIPWWIMVSAMDQHIRTWPGSKIAWRPDILRFIGFKTCATSLWVAMKRCWSWCWSNMARLLLESVMKSKYCWLQMFQIIISRYKWNWLWLLHERSLHRHLLKWSRNGRSDIGKYLLDIYGGCLYIQRWAVTRSPSRNEAHGSGSGSFRLATFIRRASTYQRIWDVWMCVCDFCVFTFLLAPFKEGRIHTHTQT